MAAASKEYQLAIKIAGSVASSFNTTMGKAKSEMTGLGSIAKKAAAIAAAAWGALKIGQFIGDAVKVYSDFDQAMANTAAIAGATAEQYGQLEAAALEMGRKTTKSATECAQALGYMSLAGWDVKTSIASLEPVLRLSEATQMDLATCSDLVTDSMSALGLESNRLSEYLDVAAMANNKSNQTAQQLMEAYLGVGGTLKGLNVPLQTSATALGVLANRGIKGSEAGNALNAILVNLTTGTGQAGKMMEKLGISAFDSNGKFIGLEETLRLVMKATEGMTEEQRNAALAAIGGKQHIDALNALMAGLNATTADGQIEWAALEKSLYGADGALMEMAGKITDTLPGAMSILNSAVDDLKIRLVQNFAPYAKDAILGVADTIPSITDSVVTMSQSFLSYAIPRVQAFAERAAPVVEKVEGFFQSLFDTIVAHSGTFDSLGAVAVAVMERAGDAIQAITPAASSALGSVLDLIGKLADMATPILQNERAVKLLVAAFLGFKGITTITSLADKFNTTVTVLDKFQMVTKGASLAQSVLKGKLPGSAAAVGVLSGKISLAELATIAWSKATGGITGGFTALKTAGITILNTLKGGITGIIASLKMLALRIGTFFTLNPAAWVAVAVVAIIATIVALYNKCEWFRDRVNAIIAQAKTYLQSFLTKAKEVLTGVWSALQEAWAQAQPYVQAVWDGITNAIQTAWTAITGAFEAAAPYIQGVWDTIQSAAGVVVDFFFSDILPGIQEVMTSVAGAFEAAWGAIQAAWKVAQPFFSQIWEGIKAVFSVVAEILGAYFRAAWAEIQVIWAVAKPWFSVIWEGIKATFSVAGAVLGGFFRTAWTTITSIWSVATAFFQAIFDTIAGIFSAVEAVLSGDFSGAWEAIKGVFSSWGSYFQSLWDAVAAIFGSVGSWFSDVFSAAWEAVKSIFGAAIQAIIDSVTGAFSTIDRLTNGAVTGAINFLSGAWDTIKNIVQVGLMFIAELINAAFQIITLPFRFIWENCKETVTAAWDAIKSGVSTAINAVASVIGTVMGTIKSGIDTATGAIKSVFDSAWNAIKSKTTEIFNAVKTAVSGPINQAKSIVSTATSSMKSAASSAWNAIKSTASSAFSSVQSTIKGKLDSAKSAASSAVDGIKSKAKSAFDSVKSTASSIFGSVYSTIKSKMDAAKNAVSNAINAIKSKFHFSWSLPKLKLPHISVSGKFSVNPPSVPKFSISWYKKGGILDGAQIFGMAGNTLLGGGEAGKEAVLPLSELWTQMREIMAEVLRTKGGQSNPPSSALDLLAEKLQAITSGKSTITEILEALTGGRQPQPATANGAPPPPAPPATTGGTPTPPVQITYAPSYHFEGEAPSKEDMVEASRMSQAEFEERMRKWLRDNDRTSF